MLNARTASNGHQRPKLVRKSAALPPQSTLPEMGLPTSANVWTPHGWLTVEYALITPERAAEMLATAGVNRTPSDRHASDIARAIAAGEFMFNGESIILDAAGKMIDGQHRCIACVKAQASIETLVVKGIRPQVFDSIDQSGKRTAGQVLKMNGVANHKEVAAAIRLLVARRLGIDMWQVRDYRPSPHEVSVEGRKYGGLGPSVIAGGLLYSQLGGPKSFYVALHYLFSQKDTQLADKFYEGLVSGEALVAGDPILALRNYLITLRQARAKAVPTASSYIAFVTTWNALRKGKQVRRLKTTGAIPEII